MMAASFDRAIARPPRVLLVAAALYLLAALLRPLKGDLSAPADGVFFATQSTPQAVSNQRNGSLVEALSAAPPQVEHSWLEAPLEVSSQARLAFDLYQRNQRELLLRVENLSAQPTSLNVRMNQMTLASQRLYGHQRFYRWDLPAAGLRLGRNSFVVEAVDSAGHPARARISWARVAGGALPLSRSGPRQAWASLDEVELPAVVQAPGTCLAVELESDPAPRALEVSIGTFDRSPNELSRLTFHLLRPGAQDRLVALFSRSLETGGGDQHWHRVRIPLVPPGDSPAQLFFVVEGRAGPEQFALWGAPRLIR
jgi:hypothetical protein